jgi:hypothetical protein
MALQGTRPRELDTGATSHMASLDGILVTRLPPSITVDKGHSIPVVSCGTSILPASDTFHLNNVLIAADIVCNLLSVCQFTHDNHCSIEFDTLGFFVKDPCWDA